MAFFLLDMLPVWFTMDFLFSSDGCTFLTLTSGVAFVIYIGIMGGGESKEEYVENIRETWTDDARKVDAAERAEKAAEVKAATDRASQVSKATGEKNTDKKPAAVSGQRKTVTIKTVSGPMSVTIVGDPDNNNKILSFHDLGLNHRYCFSTFFRSINELDKRKEGAILSQFTVYHVDAPGHGEEAADLEGELTMDGLSDSLHQVVEELGIRSFVGLGVGAGATLLMRYALKHPGSVRALMLIGPSGTGASESENENYTWICRLIDWYGMSPYAKRGITGLHFSTGSISRNSTMVQEYQEALSGFNCRNIRKFVGAYHKRRGITDNELSELMRSVPLLVTAANGAGGGLPLLTGVDRVVACEKMVERVEKLEGLAQTSLTWWEVEKLR
jgi:pimeloyl-ACP methyl ester carboxylesterase